MAVPVGLESWSEQPGSRRNRHLGKLECVKENQGKLEGVTRGCQVPFWQSGNFFRSPTLARG